jgi:hypothetical protein
MKKVFLDRVVLLQAVRAFPVRGSGQRSFTQVVVQFAADGRGSQAVQGLGFDLTDALTRHAHLAPCKERRTGRLPSWDRLPSWGPTKSALTKTVRTGPEKSTQDRQATLRGLGSLSGGGKLS